MTSDVTSDDSESDSECEDSEPSLSEQATVVAQGHLIIGDSLLRNVDPTDDEVMVACMRGAKLTDITKKLRSNGRCYKSITIVCGTNDIATKANMEKITDSLQSLLKTAKAKSKTVTICSIPPRLDEVTVSRLNSFNERLAVIAPSHDVNFVDNDMNFKFLNEIPDASLLQIDGLHLSAAGVKRLLQNLKIDKWVKCNLTDVETEKCPTNNTKEQSMVNKKRISTRSKNGITLFYGKDSVFSNLHTDTPIYVDGKKYNCNEQLYTYRMAMYFGDHRSAAKAMKITDPYKLITLQKQVKNYDRQRWLPEAEKTLYLANVAKYTQNTTARDALINTGQNIIGEATYSKTWGIGASLHDPRSFADSKWSGKNVMGQMLMKIRDDVIGKRERQSESNNYRPAADYKKYCWFCAEENHISKNCRHGMKIQCNKCLDFGHKAKFCHA